MQLGMVPWGERSSEKKPEDNPVAVLSTALLSTTPPAARLAPVHMTEADFVLRQKAS